MAKKSGETAVEIRNTQAAGAQRAPEREEYWRHFPQLEAALSAERPAVLTSIEGTCRKLDTIIKGGSPQEQARAQKAMTAYVRGLEMYRQLVEMRDKVAGGKK
jgi:hypothetical protein